MYFKPYFKPYYEPDFKPDFKSYINQIRISIFENYWFHFPYLIIHPIVSLFFIKKRVNPWHFWKQELLRCSFFRAGKIFWFLFGFSYPAAIVPVLPNYCQIAEESTELWFVFKSLDEGLRLTLFKFDLLLFQISFDPSMCKLSFLKCEKLLFLKCMTFSNLNS